MARFPAKPLNDAQTGAVLFLYLMENQGEIILYQPDNEVRLEVRIEDETVWLNRQQLSELFNRDVKTIGKHVNNALKEELADMATVAKFAIVQKEGDRTVTRQVEYYNLDMVLSVGYRVKSNRGIEFRRWANKVLKEYLLKGYSVNRRLTELEHTVVEHSRKIDFFVRTSLPPMEGIFYNSQYPPIGIHTYKKCHDRFLIIDGTDVYHIGASLKDLGKKMFAFSRLEIPAASITALL